VNGRHMPMSVEDAFAKLTGRQASPAERERLYRLRDALGLRDNDAFWSIVMALEYYDALWRSYPAQLAEEAARSIEGARAAFAAAAQKEAAEVHHALSAKVAETSVALARRLTDKPVGLHRITLSLAVATAFGTLCVHAGYRLALRHGPARGEGEGGALAALLAVPAGWMIFAFLLPAAAMGAHAGRQMAADPLAERRDKALGGLLVVLSVTGAVACAVLLARIL